MKRIFAAASAVSLAGLIAALIFFDPAYAGVADVAVRPTYVSGDIILVEPLVLVLTVAAGIALSLLGIFVVRTERGQCSRAWLSTGLIVLGAGVLVSAVGFQIRALSWFFSSSRGDDMPLTSGIEIASYGVIAWGLAALCMLVCRTSTRGKLRLWSQIGGMAAAFLYIVALCIGARYAVGFMLSPKLLLCLTAAYVVFFVVLDSMMLAFSRLRRYKLFIGGWAIAVAALAAYAAPMLAGVGSWYARAALYVLLVVFVIYVRFASLAEIRDI